MELKMPNWWETTLIGGGSIPITTAKTMYVDDHMEIHKLKPKNKKHNKEDTQAQIREILKPIFDAQEKAQVQSREEKTLVLLELHGRGSQKVRKELGGKLVLEDGRIVKIVEQAKYLGVQIGGKTQSNEKELGDRIQSKCSYEQTGKDMEE